MIELTRRTAETSVSVKLMFPGIGDISVSSGVGFLDHMIRQLAFHAAFDLDVVATGDLQVDEHHTIEDVALVLGDALQSEWRKCPRQRFGHAIVPMDDALVLSAVDLCGRPYCAFDLPLTSGRLGQLDVEMIPHFFRSLSMSGAFTLHIQVMGGENRHHLVEAAFKSTGLALRSALQPAQKVSSSKGVM